MNTLSIGTYKTTLPSKWDECSPAQVARLATVLLSAEFRAFVDLNREHGHDPKAWSALVVNEQFYRYRIECFHILLDTRWKFRLQWLLVTKIRPEHYVAIFKEDPDYVDFLFQPGLTKQPLPTVRPKRTGLEYIGPADGFQDLTMYEYLAAAERYKMWVRTRDRVWAERMMAIMWRPAVHGQRTPIARRANAYTDEVHTYDHTPSEKLFSRLPLGTVLSVVLWWQGNMRVLAERYRHVFDGPKGGRSIDNMQEVIVKLAGSPKNMDVMAASTAMVHTVLADMNANLRDNPPKP